MRKETNRTLRFLHLEDNSQDAELIKAILTDSGLDFDRVLVKSRRGFYNAIRRETFDLIISDFTIPSFSGSEALAKAKEIAPSTPFVFVSGTIGEDAAIVSLRAGATDYVLKTHLNRLVPAVKRALEEAEQKKRLKHAEKMRAIALEDLEASERKYRGIYENAPVGILNLDAEGRIQHCNPAAVRLFGYSEEELIGMKFGDITCPEDRNLSDSAFESLKSGAKEVADFDKRYVKKDGRTMWTHVTATAVRDAGGRFLYAETIINDVTARLETEAALRLSEEKYRGLVDGARDLIFSLSLDGIIESLNPAFERITGWNRDEWIGRNFTDLIHKEDVGRASSAFAKVIEEGESRDTSEYRIMKKGGGYFIGEFNSTTQNIDGHAAGIRGVGRDITAQRDLEERLRQAEKLESLGTLVGGIAHDFNNILGIILGYASFLRKSEEGSPAAQNLEMIETSAKRGVGVVRQLLTFARKQDRTIQPVSVNDVVNETYKMVIETFPKVLTVNLNLSPELLVVMGDRTEMHQAILNLCVNARDAMMDRTDGKQSGGILRLTTSVMEGENLRRKFPEAADNSYVEVAVTDTGAGMDDEVKRKIFDPFFTTKVKGKGTGLGLSTVFGITKSYRGFIDVESRPGSGTTMRLFFPRREIGNEKQKETASQPYQTRGDGETILVVEDEPGLRQLLYDILSNSGYKVLSAADGKAALAMFLEYRDISLMLSDVGLPQMEGMDLFESVRRIRPEVKVILTSGFIDENQKEKMSENGVEQFIQKPYLPEDVLRKVRKVLDAAQK